MSRPRYVGGVADIIGNVLFVSKLWRHENVQVRSDRGSASGHVSGPDDAAAICWQRQHGGGWSRTVGPPKLNLYHDSFRYRTARGAQIMTWLPKHSVVVPVDYSDESLQAVDLALSFVDDPTHLHVIHVLPYLVPTEPGVIWSTIDDVGRADHARDALRKQLSDAKYQGLDIQIQFGDPGQQIAEFAQQEEANLIVLPSHGRKGLNRLLIGSVAERVVRLAHCPVLVLRQ